MIAITSTGDKGSSNIDIRFAKCVYFCLVDNSETEFILNPYSEEETNTAPKVIDWLISKGVTQIITGEVGSNAKKYLEEKKVQIILIDEEKTTIKSILEKLMK